MAIDASLNLNILVLQEKNQGSLFLKEESLRSFAFKEGARRSLGLRSLVLQEGYHGSL